MASDHDVERTKRFILGVLAQYGRSYDEFSELQKVTFAQDVEKLTNGIVYALEKDFEEKAFELGKAAGREEERNKSAFAVKELTDLLSYSEDNLRGWTEPDGYLIPTEPDPEEREAVRRGEKGAIHAYRKALKLLTPQAERSEL